MRIVCAVDGSEHSQWGVQALEALASRKPEHVVLLHIINKPAIEANHDQLPVIGSRDLTKSERLYRGSVSESLLRHAPCSFLIVQGTRV